MTRQLKSLAGLERVAKLRSDIEMKKFSIFRAKVAATQSRIAQIEQQLQGYYDVPSALTIDEARLTNALTVETLQTLVREQAHLQRMLPAFELARSAATKEFGRVQVLQQLAEDLRKERDFTARRKL